MRRFLRPSRMRHVLNKMQEHVANERQTVNKLTSQNIGCKGFLLTKKIS